jgi:hypothetical protein
MKTVCFVMSVETETKVGLQSIMTVTILIGVDKAVLYRSVVPATDNA